MLRDHFLQDAEEFRVLFEGIGCGGQLGGYAEGEVRVGGFGGEKGEDVGAVFGEYVLGR